ncbi:MAG TPA: trypsin-like peptidase domain-containing protein [Haliangiales bacterium]|nr:trypsin-like peptidase domain-containing protein [Haliangiales bacterium]
MRMLTLLVACAACGAAAPGPAQPPNTPTTSRALTPKEIAEQALPSVVFIKTANTIGTGFVVWKDGRIATNLHVLAGAKEAVITLHDGKEYRDVEVLAADDVHDLAVVRIRAQGLAALALGDSKSVKPGEHVVAIGHPLGLGNTVSDGLVSAIRDLDPKVSLLQISAPISPGSSGGPLFNERGEVIGVTTRYATEGQNLNFAVPVAYLKPMLLAEKPIPLATFSQEMDVGLLLSGCSGEEVKDAATTILDAIKLGAPLYNKGDHQACASLYEKSSLELLSRLKTCEGIRETLLAGLGQANKLPNASDKAWALRHAFDRILGAVQAALNKATPP